MTQKVRQRGCKNLYKKEFPLLMTAAETPKEILHQCILENVCILRDHSTEVSTGQGGQEDSRQEMKAMAQAGNEARLESGWGCIKTARIWK